MANIIAATTTTFTLPDATTTVQIITNKTLDNTTNTITSANITTSITRILTLPDASNRQYSNITNKTLDSKTNTITCEKLHHLQLQ